MRVVLISRVLPAVVGYAAMLRELGHEPVALMCTRERADRYGGLADLLVDAPGELDVVIPSSRDRIAPLLHALEPDLALCTGFPWKIPADAIAVPRHGIVNGHPSLLPRYRGPSPVAWSIRNGEDEIGFTLHYMDAALDTGNILGQIAIPLGGEQGWEDLEPKFGPAVGSVLPAVLERVERGDPGDPQDDAAATYLSFFEPEYAWIDWSRSAAEIARQVRAWRFHSPVPVHGALTELDGDTVRVLRVSLEQVEGRELECGDGRLWIVESEPA